MMLVGEIDKAFRRGVLVRASWTGSRGREWCQVVDVDRSRPVARLRVRQLGGREHTISVRQAVVA